MSNGPILLDPTTGARLLTDDKQILSDGDGDTCQPCCGGGGGDEEGAICWEDGTCSIGTQADATAGGGVYQGDNTTCEEVDCDGAICDDEDECYQGTLEEANTAGHRFYGYGVDCEDVNCLCEDCTFKHGDLLDVDVALMLDTYNGPCLDGTLVDHAHYTYTGTLAFDSSTCRFEGSVNYTFDSSIDGSGSGTINAIATYIPPGSRNADGDTWSFSASGGTTDPVALPGIRGFADWGEGDLVIDGECEGATIDGEYCDVLAGPIREFGYASGTLTPQ